MGIESFFWTDHAEMRLQQRRLDKSDVELAIEAGHETREVNDGRAEWLVGGKTNNGTFFEAIYDHPHDEDETAVRIVSVWRLEP